MLIRKIKVRPTAPEAARRLVILKHLVGQALASPPPQLLVKQYEGWPPAQREHFEQAADSYREQFCGVMEDRGLWQSLSPREAKFAQATILSLDPRQRTDMCWRLEAAQCLMWALRILPRLPPYDLAAARNLLKRFDFGDHRAFVRAARLRSEEEIERARAVAELWHWRSRARQSREMGMELEPDEKLNAAGLHTNTDIIRWTAREAADEGDIAGCIADDFPAKGKAYRCLTQEEWQEVHSVTVERHFAFNWLCGYAPGNHWDKTPTDT
jgi:hypothetical protein